MKGLSTWLFGPRLYYRYSEREGGRGRLYEAHAAEVYADRFIRYPFIGLIPPWWLDWYRNSPVHRVLALAGFVISALGIAYAVRAVARFYNEDYRDFHAALLRRASKSKHAGSEEKDAQRDELDCYDYEFTFRPIDFQCTEVAPRAPKADATLKTRTHLGIMQKPLELFAFVLAHALGRPLMYPGSTTLLNAFVWDQLTMARAKLVEENGGQRVKIVTADKVQIDSMFFDRRQKTSTGGTLIITCEGNASFYELRTGYSVLSFNRPGFGGSTGTPWPDIDANAVLSVVDFAITALGWAPANIVLYAWSIGGYSAGRALVARPDISAAVLDGTFDHILPLALGKMPKALSEVVYVVVKTYLDLDVLGALKQYKGPVLLARRRRDEMISTQLGVLGSNRGNYLLAGLLAWRFPKVVDDKYLLELLKQYDSLPECSPAEDDSLETDEDVREMLKSIHEQQPPYLYGSGLKPGVRAKLTRWLASRHIVDLNLTHCEPFPLRSWRMPWKPT